MFSHNGWAPGESSPVSEGAIVSRGVEWADYFGPDTAIDEAVWSAPGLVVESESIQSTVANDCGSYKNVTIALLSGFVADTVYTVTCTATSGTNAEPKSMIIQCKSGL